MAKRVVPCGALVLLLIGALLTAPSAQATDYDALVANAKALAQAGDVDQAVTVCQSVLDARPGMPVEPKARLVMGYLLIKKKAPVAEPVTHFTTAATQFPNSPEAAESLHCLGHFALRAGDPELAIQQFEASAAAPGATAEVALDSQIEAAYACISHFWKTEDRACLRRAMSGFTSLLERQVDSKSAVMVRLGLAEACLKYGFAAKAVEHYRAALALQPQDEFLRGLAAFGLGCALHANREWQSAEQALTDFLDARPGQTLAEKDASWRATRPGYAELVAADPAKAGELGALELVPGAVCWKALAAFEQGRYTDAKAMVDDLLSRFPNVSLAPRLRELSRMCAYAQGEVR